MKNSTLLLAFSFMVSISFGQNLITNGDFEIPGTTVEETPAPWGGFKNRIVNDDITNSFAGQVENGDGSLFQEFSVTPGETYEVVFDYRWVTTAAANSTMTVRVKNALDLPTNLDLIGGTTANGYQLIDTVDVWYNASFAFTPPVGVDSVRLLFYKANGNKPLNLDNVSVTLSGTSSLNDLQQFSFSAFPNPAKDVLNLSAEQNIDQVEIYSIHGQLVRSETTHDRYVQVNVNGLAKGIYIVKAHIGKSVGSYKFIKE